jgi:hypothetical protein
MSRSLFLSASVAVQMIWQRCVDEGDGVEAAIDQLFDTMGASCVEMRGSTLGVYGITRLPDGRTLERLDLELAMAAWPAGVAARADLATGWVIERSEWLGGEVDEDDDLDEEIYDGGGLDGDRSE